jgi:hypothetical protein
MPNKYDLTINNCAITVENIFSKELKRPFDNSINLKQKIRQNILESLFGFSDYVIFDIHYYRELHGLIIDIDKESNIQTHEFSIDYLLNLNFFSDEDLASIPEKPNDGNYNSLLKKYHFSFLHNNTVVSFENDFEITIENNETLHYKFLILMLCDYGVLFIEDILNHHVQKVTNRDKFITKLKKHVLIIPEILKDKDILNEIDAWIEQNSQMPIEKKQNSELTNRELALIAFYNGNMLTRKNATNTLYMKYLEIKEIGNRLGANSKRMYNERLNNFNKVIEKLHGNAKSNAKTELDLFIKKHSNEYGT